LYKSIEVFYSELFLSSLFAILGSADFYTFDYKPFKGFYKVSILPLLGECDNNVLLSVLALLEDIENYLLFESVVAFVFFSSIGDKFSSLIE